MPVMPLASVDVSWISADVTAGDDAPTRTSSARRPLVIVKYAAESDPAAAGRAHDADTLMNPPGAGVDAPGVPEAAPPQAAARSATRASRMARCLGMG